MHTNEFIIIALIGTMLVGGILFGALASYRLMRGLCIMSIGAVVIFACTMYFAVVASAPDREAIRLPVFWSSIVSASTAISFLLAGIIGLYRRSVRKNALILACLSFLIIPIFVFTVSTR
jgi:hypothetical protein